MPRGVCTLCPSVIQSGLFHIASGGLLLILAIVRSRLVASIPPAFHTPRWAAAVTQARRSFGVGAPGRRWQLRLLKALWQSILGRVARRHHVHQGAPRAGTRHPVMAPSPVEIHCLWLTRDLPGAACGSWLAVGCLCSVPCVVRGVHLVPEPHHGRLLLQHLRLRGRR